MKRCLAAALSLACTAAALAAPLQASLALGRPLGELPRLGVNLGGRTAWGAEQLMANVLRNPGLESTLDGTLFIAGAVSAAGVEDDTPWTARPPGFWAGARYEVLSGAAAGKQGLVLDNQRTSPGRADRLALDGVPPGLAAGDVLALQGAGDMNPAPLWWTQGRVVSTAQPRPGSPGRRALRLTALPGQPAALLHHLDSIGERAGKLLPVQGRWRLSLWVRGSGPSAQLKISFLRHGRPAWLDRTLSPSSDWQELTLEFEARDDGPPKPLQLSIAATQGEVLVDDLWLGAAAPAGAGGFRPEVVQTLRALQPGYLRDWQGQLGETAANRVAEPFARQPTRYRPGDAELQFSYSLPEFLALAAEVGARPWVVLPSTSTPQEARDFGQALRRGWEKHRFGEIVVEHGNEHWNSVFRPAGIADARRLAEVADRAFAALREGAGAAVPLHRVVGTQYVNAWAGGQMAQLSRQSEGIAVAPYFLYKLDAVENADAALERALHEDAMPLRQALDSAAARGKSVDVYEVNFHTTGGNAGAAQRDAVLESPASGAALMRRLLQSAQQGVRRQAVYALAGYDTFVNASGSGPRELVKLFGITRDLAGPQHWRPTGEALKALNAVVGGAAHAADCRGDGCGELTALAFGAGARWAVVSSAAVPLRVGLPCQGALQVQPGAAPAFKAACSEGLASLDVPPRSWMTTQPSRQ